MVYLSLLGFIQFDVTILTYVHYSVLVSLGVSYIVTGHEASIPELELVFCFKSNWN